MQNDIRTILTVSPGTRNDLRDLRDQISKARKNPLHVITTNYEVTVQQFILPPTRGTKVKRAKSEMRFGTTGH